MNDILRLSRLYHSLSINYSDCVSGTIPAVNGKHNLKQTLAGEKTRECEKTKRLRPGKTVGVYVGLLSS
jgi:hypothetical protein